MVGERAREMWRKMEEEKPTVKTSLATEVMAVGIILELGGIWVLFSP